MHADSNSTYDPRVHGMTVRATAIADARVALRVGSPVIDPPLPGVVPFALTLDFWIAIGSGGSALITGNFSPIQGAFTSPPVQVVGATVTPATSVVATPDIALGYAPIYRIPENRVIGFGPVAFHPTPGAFTITRLAAPVIASVNATAVPDSTFPSGLALMTPADGALLAPVIAR
jgi:hypothetical protein